MNEYQRLLQAELERIESVATLHRRALIEHIDTLVGAHRLCTEINLLGARLELAPQITYLPTGISIAVHAYFVTGAVLSRLDKIGHNSKVVYQNDNTTIINVDEFDGIDVFLATPDYLRHLEKTS